MFIRVIFMCCITSISQGLARESLDILDLSLHKHTRIMISKGMVSKGQYSNFGPGKGFEYSF